MAADREWCFPFRHDWGRYGEPMHVTGVDKGEGMAQRRECKRCKARHYRRILITNC